MTAFRLFGLFTLALSLGACGSSDVETLEDGADIPAVGGSPYRSPSSPSTSGGSSSHQSSSQSAVQSSSQSSSDDDDDSWVFNRHENGQSSTQALRNHNAANSDGQCKSGFLNEYNELKQKSRTARRDSDLRSLITKAKVFGKIYKGVECRDDTNRRIEVDDFVDDLIDDAEDALDD